MYHDNSPITPYNQNQAAYNTPDPRFPMSSSAQYRTMTQTAQTPDMNNPATPPSNGTVIDPDFSVTPNPAPPYDTEIDPDFSVTPEPVPPYDTEIDPDFSVTPNPVPPYDTEIDPDFSVTPNPVPPIVRPPIITVIPQPIRPCLFCSSNQWLPAAFRFLNATVGYNAFTIYVGNQIVYSNLNATEITRYTRVNPGFQNVTIQAANGYVYLQKSVFFPDGMSTIAIVNSARGIDVTTISDTSCSTNAFSACIRICNLASYSGDVNVTMGNIIFYNVAFKQVTSFSNVRSGSYPLRVARSLRPAVTLINTSVSLNANRIYTLYIMNWNASADTIQSLLVEDRRN